MQLDLPKQAPAVDRREHYLPFRIKIVAHPMGEPTYLVHRQLGGGYGSVPGDPAQLVHGYGRGWQCAPMTGCRWTGVL